MRFRRPTVWLRRAHSQPIDVIPLFFYELSPHLAGYRSFINNGALIPLPKNPLGPRQPPERLREQKARVRRREKDDQEFQDRRYAGIPCSEENWTTLAGETRETSNVSTVRTRSSNRSPRPDVRPGPGL